MDYKIAAWELPSNIVCMIREENLETKKVKEYIYQRSAAAEKKVEQLMKKEGIEFTVCTPAQIHFVSPFDIEDYEDDEDEDDVNCFRPQDVARRKSSASVVLSVGSPRCLCGWGGHP